MKKIQNSWGRNATRLHAIIPFEGGDRITRISKKKIIELLGAFAFTSPADLADIVYENEKQKIRWKSFDELPDDIKKAITTIKTTPSGINIETVDRLKATELLMKYLGIKSEEAKKVVIFGEEDLEE
ncbi:MAG: terminase small subunit [Clostridia bacterium]